MNVVWIVTGAISMITGIVGGLILRQHVARLDEQRNARQAGVMLGLENRQRDLT